MRVLAISSQVAYGPVGLTAAVPALQAHGHEVLALPTITLSNHPGHGPPAGFRTAPEDLERMLGTLASMGVLAQADAALTGYFAGPEQIDTAARVLVRMKAEKPGLFVLVDPVVGDEGGLYVPEAVADAVRDRLVPLATAIMPNRFELEWLSGRGVTDEGSAIAAARAMGLQEVIATSIPAGKGQLATLLVAPTAVTRHVTPMLDKVPHGTGDILSGLYLAGRISGEAPAAFDAAMARLERAIARSAGTTVLDVAGALHGP